MFENPKTNYRCYQLLQVVKWKNDDYDPFNSGELIH